MEDVDVVVELQIKATNSVSYITSTLEKNPDIPIIATSEVASIMSSEMVIDSEISNAVLEETVIDVINPIPVSPIGIAVGLLFGLPFF